MIVRILLAEWWELWWKKPGDKPQKIQIWDQGEHFNPHMPREVFFSLKSARKQQKFQRNDGVKIVHVRRYRPANVGEGLPRVFIVNNRLAGYQCVQCGEKYTTPKRLTPDASPEIKILYSAAAKCCAWRFKRSKPQ